MTPLLSSPTKRPSTSKRRSVLASLGVTVVLVAGISSYLAYEHTSPTSPELIVGSYSGRDPSVIGFSADGGNIVTTIHWSSWNDSEAVGTGTSDIDDCVPNCAQAPIDEVPTRLTLSDPKAGHFTVITERRAGRTAKFLDELLWPQKAAQTSVALALKSDQLFGLNRPRIIRISLGASVMQLRRIALAGALLTGFWLPVFVSGSSYASSTVGECSYGQLEVATATGPGGFAGNDGVPFLIANTGKKACTVKGFPTLTFYMSGDKEIKTTVRRGRSEVYAAPKPQLITVGHDGVATFGLTYTDGWAVAHDTAACKVDRVVVSLPTINPDRERYGASLSFDMCQSNHEVSITPIELGSAPGFS